MYNHMIGRTASVITPFFSLLPSLHSNINKALIKQLNGTQIIVIFSYKNKVLRQEGVSPVRDGRGPQPLDYKAW